MRIRIDNLAGETTEEDLRMLFECFGQVKLVQVNKPRGQAQVEMASKAAARDAIAGLNGQNLKGSDLVVGEMSKNSSYRPKRPRRRPKRR